MTSGIAIGEDRVDVGVGHARVAVDDAVVQLVPHDRARSAIHLHQAGLHEPIDVRVEAAQPRRELRRKHVHGALWKVHGRAAIVRLDVERARLGHVVRDVRDVHGEPEVAVRQLVDRDRIVEVARVLAVDGHGRPVAEIRAADAIAIADDAAELLRFGDGFVAVLVRQVVLADDDRGVDARLLEPAQHFGDAAERRARRGGPLRDLQRHHLARRRAVRLAARHFDVHHEPPVERHDEPAARGIEVVAADDALGPALEDPHDAPLDAIVARVLDPHDDAVAVHRLVQVVAGDVDALGALRGPVAPDRRNANPRGFVDTRPTTRFIRPGRPNRSPRISTSLPLATRLRMPPLERGPLLARDLQELKQLLRGGGMVRPLFYQLE